ncbi:hypothetical protein MW887_001914 [Aspergillus wentii]|nr:hypothetical protein MW887_001914 [Aspergillus wentii]
MATPESFLSNLNNEIQAVVDRLEELTHLYNWRGTSDADQAIHFLQEELITRIEFLKNLRRGHSINRAQPVANETRMEIQAEGDGNLAESNTGQNASMDDVDVPVARPVKIKINIHRLPALSKPAPAIFRCTLDSFSNAEIEFSTVDRTYCSNTECNRFLHPRQVTSDRAGCTHCGSVTCTICKKPAHRDDCPEDHDLQATLALALNEKWQRCFACRAIVELDTGYAIAERNSVTSAEKNGERAPAKETNDIFID